MELITGATGYIGGRLLDRLTEEEGRPLRALARDPSKLRPREGVEAVRGDLVSGDGLIAALEGCATAYYLVHSMEAADESERNGFADRDRRAANNFASAAALAGVERIVYLGGIVPATAYPSPHLSSRLEVERILLDAAPKSTALRASIVIGAGSSSFRVLVRLVERLRVLPLPAWRDNRTQPIDERDVLSMMLAAATSERVDGPLSMDITGPDVVTYAQMVETIRDHLLLGRPAVRIPVAMTAVSAKFAAAIAGEDVGLIEPLMESLESDLLPRDDAAPAFFGVRMHSFDAAVEHALGVWERSEALAAR